MKENDAAKNLHSRIHKGVPELLEEKGFSQESIEALLGFDLSLFQWRRISEKGEFKGKMLASLEEKIEPALLQGLLSVAQITAGVGRREPQEPTIGLVAEAMSVDPSRASRIVSGLVERGFVERRAVQEDARKSVLALTPKAYKLLGDFTAKKWQLISQVFDGWDEEEVVVFSRLFVRYVTALSSQVSAQPAGGKTDTPS
ncbi:MarR family winged helix-turn-helix transcriptional regulator [Celeribacter sp.]|uniref:MarR family winged helix-turn-helix transcriptional regulator n=1 Tax=Celeribacter sp. TaxID=1890673 RepID=UPI003A94C89A